MRFVPRTKMHTPGVRKSVVEIGKQFTATKCKQIKELGDFR